MRFLSSYLTCDICFTHCYCILVILFCCHFIVHTVYFCKYLFICLFIVYIVHTFIGKVSNDFNKDTYIYIYIPIFPSVYKTITGRRVKIKEIKDRVKFRKERRYKNRGYREKREKKAGRALT